MRLKQIARQMKLEAHETGKSTVTLKHGLKLTLEPYKTGWKLTLSREDTEPSKTEYKIISKAFFDGRVYHLSEPKKNALELITVKEL